MQIGQVHGMVTFEASVNELVRKGLLNRQDAQSLLTRRGIGKTGNVLRRA